MEYALCLKNDYGDWYFMPFDDLLQLSDFLKENKFYLARVEDYEIIKFITLKYDEVVIDD